MARLVNSPAPAMASDSQQQAVIDAVARRQYGRWAVQYRRANLWAAVERDAALRSQRETSAESAPGSPAPPAGRTAADRLQALASLRDSGALSDAEFEQLKSAVLAGQ